jgi:hypothetical protein
VLPQLGDRFNSTHAQLYPIIRNTCKADTGSTMDVKLQACPRGLKDDAPGTP